MRGTGGGKRTEVRGRLRGQKQEDEGENTTQRGERLERGVSTGVKERGEERRGGRKCKRRRVDGNEGE